VAFRLKPKEEKFFQFLTNLSELVRDAAELIVQAIDERERLSEILDSIDKVEQNGDAIVIQALEKLNKTFITPFDREDIFALVQTLDDIVDGAKSLIEKLYLYNVGEAPAGVHELAALAQRCAKQVDKGIDGLSELKKQRLKLEVRCRRIAEMEMEGDKIYRQEMARLFRECSDPVEIIKWKEILENFEYIIDRAEDIANALKKVLLKYA